MTDTKCNGWTNYETWNVALWIDNEEGAQRYWRDNAREAYEEAKDTPSVNAKLTGHEPFTRAERAALNLSRRLKDEMEESWQDIMEGGDFTCSMWADLMGAALSEVNWQEIAVNWIEEAATEIDKEEADEAAIVDDDK